MNPWYNYLLSYKVNNITRPYKENKIDQREAEKIDENERIRRQIELIKAKKLESWNLI